MAGNGLTPRQQLFVSEYMIDLCATRAATRAGYSKRNAGKIGPELLGKTRIQEAIQVRRKILQDKLEITQENTLKELARIAFFDIRKLFDEKNTLKAMEDLDEDTAAAVISIDSQDITGPGGKVIGKLQKVRLANKLQALEALGKHLGLFAADNKQKGDATSEGEVRALSSLERAARVMALVRIAKKRAAEAKEGS